MEFKFRDAKQYWGIEEVMNVMETPVTNAANLAFCMANIALIFRHRCGPNKPISACSTSRRISEASNMWPKP